MPTSQGVANDKGSAGSLPRKSGDKIGVLGASRRPWVRSRSPGSCPCLDHQGFERILGQRGGGSSEHLQAPGSTKTGVGAGKCWEVKGQWRGKHELKALLKVWEWGG